ncbi:glycoside hydrolase [Paraphoma chrysanthemicola]|nr:glycoside hydrolase [Paraphoma chrysanthemicola]
MALYAVIACLLSFFVASSVQFQPNNHKYRNVTDFNAGWLFHYGDASNAQSTTLSDQSWRALSVPHDWAIEGPNPPQSPFDSKAATTGRGAYAPSGIGWYRKHFSVSDSTQNVYIDFDGVMDNASVYVNGKLIGTHPYGYTSFRYDITSAVSFSGDNVLAVKTDTSVQPGERFYTGAGIYRSVRLIATHTVHVDQYGLYVNTRNVTSSGATVRAQATILNSGSSAASVSVSGVLSGPDGAALAPATASAQSVPAGGRATFNLEVPVSSPKLWDLDTPNLYSLAATVILNGTPIDDETTTLGIRSITFSADTGMSLNGKNVKFKGVCVHQDYHGLGMAAPKRAMQRRLAQLKVLGVNSIRTSHEPTSPDFLDLTDRMGFLVLDEFFDVWTKRKYNDAGDYAEFFNQNAQSPTGTPPVPGASGAVPWYQVDVTSTVSRDRNHPSVALYSAGNEIHDSINTRTPLLKRMKEIVNALDPGRLITQALLQPSTAGDITGATRTILDVFGANYRQSEVLQAMKMSPARAGLVTEDTTGTGEWTAVQNNAGLTGLFLWTGVDYLGEADGKWTTIGSTPGLVDSMGDVKSLGYAWQKVWGAPATSPPGTGTTATKIVLTSEQKSVSTDVDDIAYIKATVSDASGKLITGSSAPITFSITGPGVIVAVDSGSQGAESFRGTQRKAYKGIAYALVRATGQGTISIKATASGLTEGSASLSGTTASFVF